VSCEQSNLGLNLNCGYATCGAQLPQKSSFAVPGLAVVYKSRQQMMAEFGYHNTSQSMITTSDAVAINPARSSHQPSKSLSFYLNLHESGKLLRKTGSQIPIQNIFQP
jgi:hypothetical protein